MSSESQAVHLEPEAIVEVFRERNSSRREVLAGHLNSCCTTCWPRLEASALPRRSLQAAEIPEVDPLLSALERAARFYAQGASEDARAEVLRPLYARHRLALRQARSQRGAFARLVLEETQLPIPWPWLGSGELSPTKVVGRALGGLSSLENEGPAHLDLDFDRDADLLRAWQAVFRGRAAHRQGAEGPRVRSWALRALHLLRRAGSPPEPVLSASICELLSLPNDLDPARRAAEIDRALAFLGEGSHEGLRSELLLSKARCLAWSPAEAAATCRVALEQLEESATPALRLEILDELASSQAAIGDSETARRLWLEAQDLSETAGEAPAAYTARWLRIAAVSATAEASAAVHQAIAGYRAIRQHREAERLEAALAERRATRAA